MSTPGKTADHSYKNQKFVGACASEGSNRGSTSTEGDYDVVWDSMKFHKQFNTNSQNKARPSTSSDNIYSDLERVTVDMSKSATKATDLFPPSSQFEEDMDSMKKGLTRTKSKSM